MTEIEELQARNEWLEEHLALMDRSFDERLRSRTNSLECENADLRWQVQRLMDPIVRRKMMEPPPPMIYVKGDRLSMRAIEPGSFEPITTGAHPRTIWQGWLAEAGADAFERARVESGKPTESEKPDDRFDPKNWGV